MTVYKTASTVRERVATTRHWLDVLERAMAGEQPFRLGEAKRLSFMKTLESLGIELMTTTQAKRSGLKPRRGQKPLGTAYYGAPLQINAPLWGRWQLSETGTGQWQESAERERKPRAEETEEEEVQD